MARKRATRKCRVYLYHKDNFTHIAKSTPPSPTSMREDDAMSIDLWFCFCRILYTLLVESYYSCMRGMISRQRNNVVKEKQRVGTHGENRTCLLLWPTM